jgi:hypothetical protein
MVLDFTNVKERGAGQFSRTHKQPGDYVAKVVKVQSVKAKKTGEKQWLYTIKIGGATYPLYIQFAENTLWKLRNLFAAAGIAVPSKRVKVDPNKVVGKTIGVALDDHEYNDKLFSEITNMFPPSEVAGASEEDADDEDEDEEEEDEESEEEDETEEEEEEEDEEEEEEEPEPPKKAKKNKAGKTKRKAQVSDEELEELDIEEI